MLGRDQDYKVKLLKEIGFSYTGDRFSHPSGFEIQCSDLRQILDEDFKEVLTTINQKIVRFNMSQNILIQECEELIESVKF